MIIIKTINIVFIQLPDISNGPIGSASGLYVKLCKRKLVVYRYSYHSMDWDLIFTAILQLY